MAGQPERRQPLQRVPPHDLETERQLLGAALLTRQAAQVAATVDPLDYYRPAHATIAEAIRDLVADNAQPDPSLVAAILRDRGQLDAIGGPHYLTDLVTDCGTTTNADRHANRIVDHANRRRTLGLAAEIAEAVYTGIDPAGVIAQLHEVTRQQQLAKPSTWEPVNLARAIAGEGDALEPTLLSRADGHRILYPGKIHSFVGEPESGKSWLAAHAAAQTIDAGGHVLYIDFEDNDVTHVSRLIDIGLHPDAILERFHYIHPDEPLGPAASLRITAALEAWPITLAVVDGIAEALALNGWDENKASDVTNLYVRLCRPLAARGAAVVTIDHVTKDKDTQGRYARGSTAKLAAIDGAVYKLEVYKPFGRGLDGAAKVTINKDRHGHVRAIATKGRVLGELHLDSTTGLHIELAPPATQSDENWRPTHLMEKVSREVEARPGLTANAIASVIGGKKQYVLDAIRYLIADGYVTVQLGARRAQEHHSTQPYRDTATDVAEPDRRYGNDA